MRNRRRVGGVEAGMRKAVISLLALALFTVACSGEQTSGLTLPSDPSALVIQVRQEGGFAPPEFLLNRLPRFTLLADGTLFFEGPQIEIYPGPLLPNIQFTQVDETTMQLVLEYVAGIGFPDITSEVNNEAAAFVADAPNDIVTYFDQSGAHVFSVYALGLTEQIKDARVVQLRDLVATLEQAAFSFPPGGQYTGERVQLFAGRPQLAPDPEFRTVQPWPLPVGFDQLRDVGLGWRCEVFGGATAAELISLFTTANQLTTWDLEGTEYTFLARPLLPGEEGCSTLEAAAG